MRELERACRRARRVLEDRRRWTQAAFARRADGRRAHPFAPAAASFCFRGALRIALGRDAYARVERRFRFLFAEIEAANDAADFHADALEAIDRVLREWREEERLRRRLTRRRR